VKIKYEDLANKARKISWLSGLNDGFLHNFIAAVEFRIFGKNEIICKTGEYEEACCLILFGSVGVFVHNKNGLKEQTAILGPGETFGEVSTITGNPRIADIITLERTEVLHMDKKALSILMESSNEIKEIINKRFRERLLKTELRKIMIFDNFPNIFFDELLKEIEYVTYSMGDTVVYYGQESNDFYIIIDGFAKAYVPRSGKRKSQNFDEDFKIAAYLPPGHYFGSIGFDKKRKRTATVKAFTALELVKIDQLKFQSLISKYCDIKERLKNIFSKINRKNYETSIDETSERLMDWIFSSNVIRTNAALLLDLNKCIRCETCVNTCEKLFGGSRLSFGGVEFNNFLIPASCWHCHEPLCLEDCPTGAISRDLSGEVYHNDYCIGCGNCAKNCSFGNIMIVNRKPKRSQPGFSFVKKLFVRTKAGINQRGISCEVLDRRQENSSKTFEVKDRRKNVSPRTLSIEKKKQILSLKIASKCDKCKDLPYMACVQNCPTGAAQRVNPHEYLMKIINNPQLLKEFMDKEINPL